MRPAPTPRPGRGPRAAAAAARPHARATPGPARWTLPRRLVLPVAALVYAAVVLRWGFQPLVLLAYLGLSLVAFLAYGIDKAAAESGRWRIPETTLHGLALCGGWPGALLAQQWFRHKTAKPPFIATFWTTVAANLAGMVALHAGWWGALV